MECLVDYKKGGTSMLFENKMGKDFENLGQRMTYVLAAQMSLLNTVDSGTASAKAQEELYSFICDYYISVFNDPSLIGIDDLPDECENNTHGGKHYLETRKLMRKVQKKITDVFDWLILCGKIGAIEDKKLITNKKEAKLTKKKLEVLERLGLQFVINDSELSIISTKYPEIMIALKYIADISPEKNSYMYIFRGIFNTDYNYYPEVYREHCTSPVAFDRVIDYVRSHGFCEEFQLADSLHEMKYTFTKTHNDMELKFHCQYDVRYYYQLSFTFVDDKKVFRWVLENFNNFDEQIQDLFFEKNKKCNKCGWCNQTDRSKPLAFITVNYRGENVELCPYFQHIRCYFLEDEYIDKVLHFFDYVLGK